MKQSCLIELIIKKENKIYQDNIYQDNIYLMIQYNNYIKCLFLIKIFINQNKKYKKLYYNMMVFIKISNKANLKDIMK